MTQTAPDQPAAAVAAEDRWVVFVHNLGGDMIAVQTRDLVTAERAAAASAGCTTRAMFAEATCCCGPSWTLREYFDEDSLDLDALETASDIDLADPAPAPDLDSDLDEDDGTDASYPFRPSEDDVLSMGPRWDGTPRSRYITADELPGLLAAYTEQHGTDEPENADDEDAEADDDSYFSCC